MADELGEIIRQIVRAEVRKYLRELADEPPPPKAPNEGEPECDKAALRVRLDGGRRK